jgi:hypothetical protein
MELWVKGQGPGLVVKCGLLEYTADGYVVTNVSSFVFWSFKRRFDYLILGRYGTAERAREVIAGIWSYMETHSDERVLFYEMPTE